MQEDLWKEYYSLVHTARSYVESEKKSRGDYAFIPGCKEKLKEIEQQEKKNPIEPVVLSSQPKNIATKASEFARESSISFLPKEALSMEQRIVEMESLRQKASQCTKCALSKQGRTQVVFGSGSLMPKIVIVSDFPGFEEDKLGMPIAGEARQLLDKMLASIKISSQDIYICHCLQCRVPGNYTPQASEILACRPWLLAQINLLRPHLILAAGPFAAHKITGVAQAMWRYRGNTYSYEGIPVVCTYHPKYLLQNPDDKRNAWQDLLRIQSFFQ